MVKAPPDEEAPDEAAARQPVLFVHVDSEQTTVSLVVNPVLIWIRRTCTGASPVSVCGQFKWEM